MTKFIKNADISDTLIERPIGFSVKGRHFQVFHPSLGKIYLVSRLLEAIGVGDRNSSADLMSLSYFAAANRREECLRIIAYSTLPGKDCLDEEIVKKQLSYLKKLDDKDCATLLVIILALDKTNAIMKHFGMDTERNLLSRAVKAKEKKGGSLDFGGKSIWGTLIDAACERYGWSYDYVLWGISYSNLRLLLADHIKTIYLTDEERKKAHLVSDREVIKADDPKALEDFIKRQSWR